MTSKYQRILFAVLASLFANSSSAAFSGGVRSDYNLWQTGIDGVATGPSVGADISYNRNSWYGGGGFAQAMLGSKSGEVKIDRGDADFVIGRMMDENWSAFLGFKSISLSYRNDTIGQSYREAIRAFGAGANGLMPVFPKSYLYGTVSLSYLMSSYQGALNDVASGYHVGEEIGVLYNVNGSISVRAGVKHQWFLLRYSSVPNSWVSDLYRLGAQISYRF